MAILILGASGFIGRHVAAALEAGGFEAVRGRRPAMDLARDFDPQQWRARLEGIETVVNAVGIFQEEGAQTFDAIHTRGPLALFEACASMAVNVVQISALGADAEAQSRFHISKRAADEALLALPIRSVVLQPSLVFGADGESARMFALLARLPIIPLPAGGVQMVQPVHVDDLAAVVVAILKDDRFDRSRVPVVGARALTLRDFIAALRRGLALGKPRFLSVPGPGIDWMAALGVGKLDRESWGMLQRGNTGDASRMRELLRREPRAPEDMIAPAERDAINTRAALDLVLPPLRVAIAIMWIAAGVLSAGVFPVDESLALLERVGATGRLATTMLYGAAAFDFAMGIATLFLKRRRLLWLLQAATIVSYTVIITIFLPEQWLHPFGPVVKNLPILAAILLLYELEPR